MITNTATSFQTLPKDLNLLILEFLPVTDYLNLQLVSRDFHIILSTNPSLWAKHLFSDFLDPSDDSSSLFDDELLDENPLTGPDGVNFDTMTDSKALICKHFAAKSRCRSFFKKYLEQTPAGELTDCLFKSLKNPSYPVPVLKKDIHFFPTNSIFQNFLTEVHFGLHNQSKFLDKRQSLFKNVVEGIRSAYTTKANDADNAVDVDKFLSLRWYMFDSIDLTENENEKEKGKGEEEDQEDPISGMYKLIYSMISNHCKMILTFLKAVKEPQDFLSEYGRLWDNYVLTILELNRVFCSFANLFNEVYNSSCQGFPNFPEFSIWRLMVKIWINEVYTPILDRLQSTFRSTLMLARIAGSFFSPTNSGDTESPTEKKIKLLRESYQGMCDLSYDELTIFYWNCLPASPETPKGVLDSVIMQDTLQLYECCKKFFFKNPGQVDSFLKGDVELAENLFCCKELVLKTKQGQMTMVKDCLEEIFTETIDNLNWELEKSVQVEGESEGLGYSGYTLNFDGVMRLFKTQETVIQKIWADKSYREMLCKLIISKCSQFNSFVRFLMDIKEELEGQYQEFQEVSKEMEERGFPQIDKKYESFFAFNQNPSSLYVHNESGEGNNNEEEQEQGDEYDEGQQQQIAT